MTRSAKRWRDHLPIHPAAELFPLMGEAELRELADDIKKSGLRYPARTLVQNGTHVLLDGRNRLDALELIGERVFDGSNSKYHSRFPAGSNNKFFDEVVTDGPFAYVISANIHRRHLNVEQRQELLITLIARSPGKSDRQIGNEIGVDHKTVGRARTKGEDVGHIPHVRTRTDTKGRKQPVKPRGMTQQRQLGIFNRAISSIYNHCENTEDALNEFLPRLSAQQKADAKRQLMDAIGVLRKCLALVAKAGGKP